MNFSTFRTFGKGANSLRVNRWIKTWERHSSRLAILLILAGSRTAEVEGISDAGSTPLARKYTALADAELLLYGPSHDMKWQLPPLPAGVSPALISHVASRLIDVDPIVLAVGLYQNPSFPYLCVEPSSIGPSNCVSTGKAMSPERVRRLWDRGYSMGLALKKPLLLAECVPGGTTTAQAVLTGMGLSVDAFISGSNVKVPIGLKRRIVERGLRSAKLDLKPSPEQLLAAVGDPFQAIAAGLILGAREAGQDVFLGGGSQMLAVLALALLHISSDIRSSFVEGIAIGTTSWLMDEMVDDTQKTSSLQGLINLLEEFFGIGILVIATKLSFKESAHRALVDYEHGYIKEGVGAGAFSLLAELQGISPRDLADSCDLAFEQLIGNS